MSQSWDEVFNTVKDPNIQRRKSLWRLDWF